MARVGLGALDGPSRRATRIPCSSARQASKRLWDIVQTSQAYRLPPRASLYNDREVRDAVQQSVAHCRDGALGDLVPRTMLSLAYLGGPLVWEDEMNDLAASVDVDQIMSLRSLDDVVRALKLCRHKGEAELVTSLAVRGHDLLERAESDAFTDITRAVRLLRLASASAGNILYHGVVPEKLLQRLADALLGGEEVRADARVLGAMSFAATCAHTVYGWDGDGHREVTSVLMDCVRGAYQGGGLSENDMGRLHPFLLCYCSDQDPVLKAAIVARRSQRRKHTVSTFQRELYDTLRSYLGVSCSMEGDVRGISVDIAVESARVAIEADGASHFYRNAERELVPASRCKSAMVNRFGSGWRLAHVDQQTWDAIQDRQDRGEYLRKVLGGCLL